MAKVYDLVIGVKEYQNREGETKTQWLNVGGIFEKEKEVDGENVKSHFILMSRTFNPAGVPNPDDSDQVLISMFKVKDREQEQ